MKSNQELRKEWGKLVRETLRDPCESEIRKKLESINFSYEKVVMNEKGRYTVRHYPNLLKRFYQLAGMEPETISRQRQKMFLHEYKLATAEEKKRFRSKFK